MNKSKYYYRTKFSMNVIEEAYDLFLSKLSKNKPRTAAQTLMIQRGNEEWKFDSFEEFLSEIQTAEAYRLDHIEDNSRIIISFREHSDYTFVEVQFASRTEIETICNIFEKHADKSKIQVEVEPVKVFIGHGRDNQWRDLRDHLQDKHGLDVIAYEIGPRAGLSVKEVLNQMLVDSSFAFLVLTGEDEYSDRTIHARENVIHELGLFQGKLGFTRAIPLLENGVKEFSNIFGIDQIRFSKNNIKETYGEVIATIRREFI
jgi:predicted nucleotide-binding protein